MVAGVLAGFMTDGLSPVEAREKLYTVAWPRINTGRNVVYNGIDTGVRITH